MTANTSKDTLDLRELFLHRSKPNFLKLHVTIGKDSGAYLNQLYALMKDLRAQPFLAKLLRIKCNTKTLDWVDQPLDNIQLKNWGGRLSEVRDKASLNMAGKSPARLHVKRGT
jgi:hypothetical protein